MVSFGAAALPGCLLGEKKRHMAKSLVFFEFFKRTSECGLHDIAPWEYAIPLVFSGVCLIDWPILPSSVFLPCLRIGGGPEADRLTS